MSLEVKICGIRSPDALEAAVSGGARYVGLVFYPRSPRAVDLELAAELSRRVPTGVRVVGLFVDPSDDQLEATLGRVPLDLVQLHGNETPARVAGIRASVSAPVMKAIRIATHDDLASVPAFADVADMLLFDAKPPPNVAALPGGNGIPFDWTILAGRQFTHPWMLSGGLTADNVAEAVRLTGASAVDVSSGVESRPGHKEPTLIGAFLRAADAIADAPVAG